MQFAVAAALRFGTVKPQILTQDMLQQVSLLKLMQRITMEETEELNRIAISDRCPECARLSIEFHDGSVRSQFVGCAKGTPENPFSDEDVERKFHDCFEAANKSRNQSAQILENLWCLELLENVSVLFKAIDEPES